MAGQVVRKDVPVFAYTFVVYGISTLTLFLYVLLNGQSFFTYGANDWLMFVLLAIFPNLLGHSIYNWSVKWVGVNTLSMTILGEPIGSSILAYFIFGEKLHFLQVIGSLTIFIGITIYLFSEKKNRSGKIRGAA